MYWRTIPFEPAYEISSEGQVRNIKTKHVKSLRMDKYGYRRVTLYPSGKTYSIHRLVLMSFQPLDSYGKLQVNHKNGIKTDNRLENLEWTTPRGNTRHAINVLKYDRAETRRGSLNPQSKLTESQVKYIKHSCLREHYSGTEIGELYGVNPDTICSIWRGDSWKHI